MRARLFPSRFDGDRSALRSVLLAAFGFFLLAHAYRLLNPGFAGNALTINAASLRAAQTEEGRWLLPYFIALRGAITTPFLIGLLCAFFMALAAWRIAALWHLRRAGALILLSALLCFHPAGFMLLLTRMEAADAALLAFLLAVLAVELVKGAPLGFLPAALCLVLALGLDGPACAATFASLVLLRSLHGLLCNEEEAERLPVRGLIALLPALACYGGCWVVLSRRMGIALSFSTDGLLHRPIAAAQSLLASLPHPLSAYPHIAPVLCLALAAAALLWLTQRLLRLPGKERIAGFAMLFALAALLFCAIGQSFPLWSALLGLPFVLLLEEETLPRRALAACGCLAVLFLGNALFANQAYLLADLQYDTTLSVMTRVLDRLERTPGYELSVTPVALIGDPSASPLAEGRVGFEHVTQALEYQGLSIQDERQTTRYLWEILGYPANLVSDYERELLREDEAVQALAPFPAEDCLAWVNGVLVIKLAESPVNP